MKERTIIVKCPECKREFRMWVNEYKLMVLQSDEGNNWLRLKCPDNKDHYMMALRKKVDAVPKETRQKLLDLMRKGWKLGNVGRELNLDLETASQILADNIGTYSYLKKKVED